MKGSATTEETKGNDNSQKKPTKEEAVSHWSGKFQRSQLLLVISSTELMSVGGKARKLQQNLILTDSKHHLYGYTETKDKDMKHLCKTRVDRKKIFNIKAETKRRAIEKR